MNFKCTHKKKWFKTGFTYITGYKRNSPPFPIDFIERVKRKKNSSTELGHTYNYCYKCTNEKSFGIFQTQGSDHL